MFVTKIQLHPSFPAAKAQLRLPVQHWTLSGVPRNSTPCQQACLPSGRLEVFTQICRFNRKQLIRQRSTGSFLLGSFPLRSFSLAAWRVLYSSVPQSQRVPRLFHLGASGRLRNSKVPFSSPSGAGRGETYSHAASGVCTLSKL